MDVNKLPAPTFTTAQILLKSIYRGVFLSQQTSETILIFQNNLATASPLNNSDNCVK